jgi:hypothetical protein
MSVQQLTSVIEIRSGLKRRQIYWRNIYCICENGFNLLSFKHILESLYVQLYPFYLQYYIYQ